MPIMEISKDDIIKALFSSFGSLRNVNVQYLLWDETLDTVCLYYLEVVVSQKKKTVFSLVILMFKMLTAGVWE